MDPIPTSTGTGPIQREVSLPAALSPLATKVCASRDEIAAFARQRLREYSQGGASGETDTWERQLSKFEKIHTAADLAVLLHEGSTALNAALELRVLELQRALKTHPVFPFNEFVPTSYCTRPVPGSSAGVSPLIAALGLADFETTQLGAHRMVRVSDGTCISFCVICVTGDSSTDCLTLLHEQIHSRQKRKNIDGAIESDCGVTDRTLTHLLTEGTTQFIALTLLDLLPEMAKHPYYFETDIVCTIAETCGLAQVVQWYTSGVMGNQHIALKLQRCDALFQSVRGAIASALKPADDTELESEMRMFLRTFIRHWIVEMAEARLIPGVSAPQRGLELLEQRLRDSATRWIGKQLRRSDYP